MGKIKTRYFTKNLLVSDWKSYHKAKVTSGDIEVHMLNLCLEEVISTMFTSVLSEVIKNSYGGMNIGVDMKKNVIQ